MFPHAPMQPVTINQGMVMRAWYDVVGNDLARREDERLAVQQHQLLLEPDGELRRVLLERVAHRAGG